MCGRIPSLNMEEIYYKQITEGYSYAHFLGVNVIIKHDDGYVNATQLCKDGNKDFKNWKRLKQSQDFIKYYELKMGVKDELFKVINGGKGVGLIIRGTYVHPNLITVIASWVSLELADRVGLIARECAAEEWKNYSQIERDARFQLSQAMIEKMKVDKENSMSNDNDGDGTETMAQHRAAKEKVRAEKAAIVIDKYAEKVGYENKHILKFHLDDVLKLEVKEGEMTNLHQIL